MDSTVIWILGSGMLIETIALVVLVFKCYNSFSMTFTKPNKGAQPYKKQHNSPKLVDIEQVKHTINISNGFSNNLKIKSKKFKTTNTDKLNKLRELKK